MTELLQTVEEPEKKTCKTYFMWLTVLLFLQMNLQYLFMSLFSSKLCGTRLTMNKHPHRLTKEENMG